MSAPPCHRRLLAQSPQARVEACSCGLIHVSAGPITLRLEAAACEALTTVLARAMVEMVRLREEAAPSRLRLVPDRGAP